MLQSVTLATKGDTINYGAKIFSLTPNSISKMFLFFPNGNSREYGKWL